MTMQAVDREVENQRSYERLMVALEASQGKLDLLIAICDDRNLQETLMRQYIAELEQQGITHYRISVQPHDPSLRQALGQLVQQQPALQQGSPAVVTVQGIDGLLSARLGKSQSEQERLFGYLQWTREALRDFQFPVVIWVNRTVLQQLVEKAPDFWSWRGGVFWFEGKAIPQPTEEIVSHQTSVTPVDNTRQEITDLLQQIEQQEGQETPSLAALYEQLGQVYAQRTSSSQDRQFAIQTYKRAVQLQRKLGLQAELAESLERLGNLYFELKDNVEPAFEAYSEAMGLYRAVGDRLGEANTLKAIGDVLQFLKRSTEALENYEQAMGLYRAVGDRLGEANTLQAIGDVLQFLDRRTEALANYEQAIKMYRTVGDAPMEALRARLGEANTLKAIGDVLHLLDRRTEALANYEQAMSLYRAVDNSPTEALRARLGEANTLKAIGDVLQFLNRRTEALANYEQVMELYRMVGDRIGEADTLQAIGDVLQFLNRRAEALANYEQAMELYRMVGDRIGEADTLKAIGDVLQFLDRRAEALANYEQAMELYRAVRNRWGEANVLQELGNLQDDPEVGLNDLNQAQEIYESIDEQYSQILTFRSIADRYLELQNTDAAIYALQQGAALAAKIDDESLQQDIASRIAELQESVVPQWLQWLKQFTFLKRWLLGVFIFMLVLVVKWLMQQ